MKVELFEWDSGDWSALYVDGKCVSENHSVQDSVYLNIIKSLGAKILVKEVFDDNGGLCRRGVEVLREAPGDFLDY